MFKVIIVDDERLVREGLKRLVDWGKLGFELCGEAEDGCDALELIKKENPELVITDIRMPEVSGLELIRRIVEEMAMKTRFIVLSAYNDFIYAQSAMSHNVKDYLLKPVEEEELEKVLKRMHEEIKADIELKSDYVKGMDAIANQTCKKIVNGDTLEGAEIKMESLLYIGDGKPVQCIIVEIEDFSSWMNNTSDHEIYTNKQKIRWAIEELIGIGYSRNIFDEEINRFGILVNEGILNKFGNNIRNLTSQLYDNIVNEYKWNISILVGVQVNCVEAVKESYKTALQALNYRFIKGEKSIVFYSDIKDIAFKYKIEDIKLFEKLLKEIENNDLGEIKKNIDFIFIYFHSSSIAPECIKAYVINFVVNVIKIVSDLNGDADSIIKNNTSLLDFDTNTMTVPRLKKLLLDFCSYSSDYVKGLVEKHPSSIMTRIEEYIKENYKYDIRIKSVAKEFYMNPTYLGQLFKKSFGMYFNDYINNLRLEEAKKLLKRTEYKVYEIADIVGYSNADYFTNKFESVVGIPPLQYRKSADRLEINGMGDKNEKI